MLDDRALASDSQFDLNQSDWQIRKPYLAEPACGRLLPISRLWEVFAVSSERYYDPESRSASLGAFRDAGCEKAKDIGVECPYGSLSKDAYLGESSVLDRKASLEVDIFRSRNFSKTAALCAIAVSTLLPASFSR